MDVTSTGYIKIKGHYKDDEKALFRPFLSEWEKIFANHIW